MKPKTRTLKTDERIEIGKDKKGKPIYKREKGEDGKASFCISRLNRC